MRTLRGYEIVSPLILALLGFLSAAAVVAEDAPVARTSWGSPADPHPIPAVDCVNQCPPGYQATWDALTVTPDFQNWAQGEYVGRARLPHVPVYRLRVDDQLEFVFRVDRDRQANGYKLNVGDSISVDSASDPSLRRTLIVVPDGTITLPLIGSVPAEGMTVEEVRQELDRSLRQYINDPAITVTADKTNSKLEDLRYTIAGLSGFGGQTLLGRVTPEGTIQLPAVGSVPAQGLSLDELKLELNERFAEKIEGMEVVPVLSTRAARTVYVLGEVARPGRYQLAAPTTVMQAIAMAGSWTVGGKIAHVVVLRRADDWRLIATRLDLPRALLGKEPCPGNEIWVCDNDLIIIPKSRALRTDNFIDLVVTRGIYGVVPFRTSVNYFAFTGLLPILPPAAP